MGSSALSRTDREIESTQILRAFMIKYYKICVDKQAYILYIRI